MGKPLATLMLVIGLATIIFGVVLWVYPQWLDVPGRWLVLLGAIVVAVVEMGDKIKGWADFFFGEDTKSAKKHRRSKRKDAKLNVNRNLMIGKNSITTRNENADIDENTMLGENKINVSKGSKKTK